MTVTQTFTYLPDGFVFEFVKCDDGSTHIILTPDGESPIGEYPTEDAHIPPTADIADEPPPVDDLAAAPTKKKRTLMGIIRASWFYIFTALGGVVDYGIQRYTDLPVPTGTGTLVGGALYGLKRAFWPDTTI